MPAKKPVNDLVDKVTRQLVDEGKIIEAGWAGLRIISLPADAPQYQLDALRGAFFAGAQHLFSSILTVLEPGAEPTNKDMNRLSLIDKELRVFVEQFKAKHSGESHAV